MLVKTPDKILVKTILARIYVGVRTNCLVVMHCFKQAGKCRKMLVKTPDNILGKTILARIYVGMRIKCPVVMH